MNNGYSNLKPNIALRAAGVFSASVAFAGLAPLEAVLLSDLPDGLYDLSVEVICRCGETTVFSGPVKTLHSFQRALCGDGTSGALIRFSASDFEIDYSFLNALTVHEDANLSVRVTVGETVLAAEAPVRLAPREEWQGIDVHPETLASFICPDCESVRALTKGVARLSEPANLSERFEVLRGIVRGIRARSMICAARDSYSPERRQHIKSHDALCTPNTAVASPVELAALFCACAEQTGLAPVVLFTASLVGTVNIFCGVRAAGIRTFMLSESLTKVRDALENDELTVFDPAVLSSAQSIDASLAASDARNYFRKAGTTLLVALDVAVARECSVAPFASTLPPTAADAPSSARDTLAALYTGLPNSRVFKPLNGVYGGYDVIPFVGARMDDLCISDRGTFVDPLEISEKPAPFAGLADDFASFALKDERVNAYNKAELEAVSAALDGFREKIRDKKTCVAGLYERAFHERASRMAFGDAPGMKNYLIYGFVRLRERENAETRYLPLCFAEIEFSRDERYRFSLKPGAPVVNTVLASYLSEDEPSFCGDDTPEKAFAHFEALAAEAVNGKNEAFSEIRVIREAALIKADLSDFILWNDIRENARVMLRNQNFASLLCGGKDKPEPAFSPDRVFARFAATSVRRSLLYRGNVAVLGDAVKEKADYLINRAAADLSDGATLLVASENPEFIAHVGQALDDAGLSEAVLDLTRCHAASEVCEAVLQRAQSLETVERSAAAPGVPTELDEMTERLRAYADSLTQPDSVLGASLLDLVESYDSARGTLETAELLEVEKSVFADMTGAKFNALFEMAETLVNRAREALRAAGISESAPLSGHPLYSLAPERKPDDESLREAYELVSRILPALSSYRETFLDINDELAIEISDIKTLSGLAALNEIYRLMISARELEIPPDFPAHGISSFADGEVRKNRAKTRMENIEYQLRFFSPELFEDVDTLLSGYSGEIDGETNFIKKFLIKKNHKDVLLQYVPPENRGEFSKHAVSDIYKLLGEYRRMKTLAADRTESEDNAALASLIRAFHDALREIYPALSETPGALDQKLVRLFAFVARLSSDAGLSKKLTYARARFVQVYSENECMTAQLEKLLGADFSSLYFENGALNYDGFSAALKRIEENLPALPEWVAWLAASREAKESLPSFAEYLCRYGVRENTDRLFAASLILPAARYVAAQSGLDKIMPAVERAKQKYPALVEKYAGLAVTEALSAHRQRVKHCFETENLAALFAADKEDSLRAFVSKHKKRLLRVFPVILVNAAEACAFFGGEPVADTVLCDDSGMNGRLTLASFSCARRVVMFCDLARRGYAARVLLSAGAFRTDVSYHTEPSVRDAAACFGSGPCYAVSGESPALSLVRVNGTMRFSGDLACPAEAETCVSKAIELAGKSGKRTAVFAFTHGQCAYIRHLLCLAGEKDKNVREQVLRGDVVVRDATVPCYETFENAVITFGAAADKEGALCRACGFGTPAEFRRAMFGILCAVRGNAVFVASLSAKELAALAGRSSEAGELYFAIQFLSSGTVPLTMSDFEDDEPLFRRLLVRNAGASPAVGRFACGADALDPERGRVFLYDCTDSENLFERLAVCELIRASGMECRCVSPAEDVLHLSGRKTD